MKRITVLCEGALAQKMAGRRIPDYEIICLPPLLAGKPLPKPDSQEDVLAVQLTAASAAQDFLSHLSGAKRALILLFELTGEKVGYCAASSDFPDSVLAGLERLLDIELRRAVYPDENWAQRFAAIILPPKKREIRKTILYGISPEEFESVRSEYAPALKNGGYYMFVWELAKCELEDYAVNKDLHYYLHAKRLEEFSAVLAAHTGGEILFSDISFAYILLNAPDSRSAALRTRALQHVAAELAAVSGERNAFCFLSDFIPDIAHVPRAYAAFGKACASRFFCREARVLTPSYISAHKHWIDSGLIADTVEQVKHLIQIDLAGQALADRIRKLYIEIIKPSMSYMLYYVITESILICLEQEQSAKMVLDTFNDPHLILQTPYLSVEESCERVLRCIAELSGQKTGRYAVQSDLVKETVSYIDAHINSEIRIGVLAQRINVSPAYLGQRFKAETGSTIKDYAAKRRLQLAKTRLLRSNDPIAIIASDLGFSDYSCFSRLFKKYAGISPSQYRKLHFNDSPVGGIETHFSPEIRR